MLVNIILSSQYLSVPNEIGLSGSGKEGAGVKYFPMFSHTFKQKIGNGQPRPCLPAPDESGRLWIKSAVDKSNKSSGDVNS